MFTTHTHTHKYPVVEPKHGRRRQGHTRPRSRSNALQIHHIRGSIKKKNEKRAPQTAFSNEDLGTRGGGGGRKKVQVQFKFKAKGSSFIQWHPGTRLHAAVTTIRLR